VEYKSIHLLSKVIAALKLDGELSQNLTLTMMTVVLILTFAGSEIFVKNDNYCQTQRATFWNRLDWIE